MHRVVGGDPLLLQRRAQVMDAYAQLQHDHPALPPSLHDFQVMSEDLVADRMASKMWQLQADITAAVVDEEERHHILSCLPTGMGKTLPMLLTSQLLPLGNFLWSWTCVPIGTRPFKVQRRWLSRHSPPSSCNWRTTATSLAFQLLLETRYCQLLTWKCALCSLCASPLLLPTTMSASFCFYGQNQL